MKATSKKLTYFGAGNRDKGRIGLSLSVADRAELEHLIVVHGYKRATLVHALYQMGLAQFKASVTSASVVHQGLPQTNAGALNNGPSVNYDTAALAGA